jgi:hypothetical protein
MIHLIEVLTHIGHGSIKKQNERLPTAHLFTGKVCILLSSPSDNLVNPLFGDTEGLGDTGLALACFVSCLDFFITFRLRRHQIVLRFGREWRVVQHLHDVKRRQPNIEASCGFEPPWGTAFKQ